MKKPFLSAILFSLIFCFLCSCGLSDQDKTINAQTTVQIRILYDNINEKINCNISVGVPWTTTNPDPAKYQNCTATMNGINVPFTNLWDYAAAFYYYGDVVLNAGNSVTVTVSHPEMDTVTATGVVPPAVTNAWVTGNVPGYVAGNPTTVTVSWDPVSCTQYLAWMKHYNAVSVNNFSNGYQVNAGTTHQFNQADLLDIDGIAAVSVSFAVESQNAYDLPGLAQFSEMVCSPLEYNIPN